MAPFTSSPHTLEPLPGEAIRPPLRLLERRVALPRRRPAPAPTSGLSATSWWQVLRRWVGRPR